jgi:AAA domain
MDIRLRRSGETVRDEYGNLVDPADVPPEPPEDYGLPWDDWEPPDDEPPPPDDASSADAPLVNPQVKLRAEQLTSQLLTVDGLRNIPPPTPLVDGYLYLNSLAWLGGKPGHAKTVLAVELACCVATGQV